MGLIASAVFFVLFISVVSAPDYLPHPNIQYGSLNTSQLAGLNGQTYLKVYYSELCTVCSQQMPILEGFAGNGTRIIMIEVNQEPDTAQRDEVTTTPTIFVIDGASYERLEGLASSEELQNAIEMVRNKSRADTGVI